MAEGTRLNFTGDEIYAILQNIPSHVSFSTEQAITDDQKAMARNNIGAVSSTDINEIVQATNELDNILNNKIDCTQAQELSVEQRRQAQKNLGLNIIEKTSEMVLPVGRSSDGKFWTSGIFYPNNWEEVGAVLEKGLAPKYWEPGDQLRIKKTINSTTEELIFDILGFDYDTPINTNVKHTMSLVMHSVYNYDELPFDEQQALFYFSNGLPAGTYTYKYNGIAYSFTLTNGWSPNTQVVGTTAQLTPYIKGALNTSGEETPTAVAGTAGTSLGTSVDNTGSSTILTIGGINYPVEMNACYRVTNGSNRWETSSSRQYLNSNTAGAASGQIASWWTPQTGFDRPVISTQPGFLYGIEQGFLDLLVDVKKRTRLCNAGDVTGDFKDSDEKVFFLSQTEVNFNMENNVNENSFGTDRTFTNILTTPYPLYAGAENADRIKYNGSDAIFWWLRSPVLAHAGIVHDVDTQGGLFLDIAYYPLGIVPALCIGR